ncbi:MAG: MFS transporter [Anaerolineae bacterium]|nr:MAG: MFS transporter [Anaerolineae bacterium]
MKKPLSLLQLLVINTYWVGLSFMWNSLHPIVLPAVLLNFVPDAQKNTYLGLLTFIGLIIAMLIQPISGALSDGWASRWGRRRPLIVLGTLFDFVFLAILAWAGGLTWLVIGYIGLQFSSNIAHGPAQGLIPDRVPEQQLGMASAWKTFMDMASLIVASLLAGRLLNPETRDPTLIVLVMIGLLAAATAITVLGTKEEPTTREGGGPRLDLRHLLTQFRIDLRASIAYWWLIGSRFLYLIGIYGVQAFAQYYLQDVLRVPDPPKQTGDLLASLTITLIILVLAGGWLSDRFGAKRVLYASGIITAVGMLLMLLADDMTGLLIFGSLLGAGIGLFLTANWTLATQLAPREEAGKFLGLTNLATAGSGALARLEGPAIDLLNHAWPGLWAGYTGMFLFGAVSALLSMFLLRKVDAGHHNTGG